MDRIPSQRIAKLSLILLGVFFLGSLACAMPLAVSQTPTASQEPLNTVSPAMPSLPANTSLPPAPEPTATGSLPSSPEISEVQIYLVAVGDGGSSGKPVGCGDSLVAVTRQVQPTRQPIVAALNELFTIKEQFLGQSGLYNALYQSNLQVESAEIDANGIARVVLTGQVMMGGECDTPRFKGQIEQTILSSGEVQSANIFLNGKTIDQALSLK